MNPDYIPAKLQRQVRERAGDRCEYCRLSQAGQEATFHVDHVRPRREGGTTVLANLALACVSCSLRKGARTAGLDPQTGTTVDIFDPRTEAWGEHFLVHEDFAIRGRTPAGRATVELLRINRPLALEIRREEALQGRFPRDTE